MFHKLGLTNEADAPCNKNGASLDSTNNIHCRCYDIIKAPTSEGRILCYGSMRKHPRQGCAANRPF